MRHARFALMARACGTALAFGLVSLMGAAPVAAQDNAVTQAGDAAASTDDNGQDIVVTGTREGQRKAIAEKRQADNTVEALQANDVGKLPDQNVAEAVKRLPGLSVANDQGEGRYVVIRGIDPSLINVSLNGQTLPAPEPDGRQVKLDDLPSAMIQSITVTKSLLPSQDANAIGGDVNIRTKTAFDSKAPFFLDARGSAGWYAINGKTPYELDGTVGGRFGTDEQFGAVVSVNYSSRPITSENFQGSEDYTNDGVPDQNGLRDYNLTRTRLGIVGNFDWHPTDTFKVYLRSSYSKFTDHETRDQNRLALNFPVTTESSATTGVAKATGTILVRRREEDDNTKSFTLGTEFQLGNGTVEASGGWTKAVKLDPIRSEFTFTSAKNALTVDYDLGTYPYTFAARGAPFNDPSQFTFSKYNLETRQAFEEIWQGRIDYTLPIPLGDGSTFKAGFKYLTRHKNNNQDKQDYKVGSQAWGLGNVGYIGDTDFYGGQFNFGERIDYFAARAFLEANPKVAKLDAAGTLADTLSSDYDVHEDIVAGYVMTTLKFGRLTLVPGVRIEHTQDKTLAKIVGPDSTLNDGFNSFGRKSYTDVFPGLNARFDVTRQLLVRGAVTTSIGRPNYPDLAPYVIVEDDTVPNISLGNPGLKPYRAVNLDASIEYYPNQDSIFSVGVFWKHIDNPIYGFNDRQTNVTVAGVLYPVADIGQPINADDEVLSGVEANAQTQFTFLPGIFSGFGISANYTHVEGHATAAFVRPGNIPLGFQSKNIGNVQLFYEKYGFAARLAFNYRSSYLDTLGGSAAEDEYTDGNGQLDLHISYQIRPQITIFGDATNLTDAPWRRYIGDHQFLIERERYDTMLRGGVQIHF